MNFLHSFYTHSKTNIKLVCWRGIFKTKFNLIVFVLKKTETCLWMVIANLYSTTKRKAHQSPSRLKCIPKLEVMKTLLYCSLHLPHVCKVQMCTFHLVHFLSPFMAVLSNLDKPQTYSIAMLGTNNSTWTRALIKHMIIFRTKISSTSHSSHICCCGKFKCQARIWWLGCGRLFCQVGKRLRWRYRSSAYGSRCFACFQCAHLNF